MGKLKLEHAFQSNVKMWYKHNIKDNDDNKELMNEINNDFLCAYFNYQLKMVNWVEYNLVINEVQRFN